MSSLENKLATNCRIIPKNKGMTKENFKALRRNVLGFRFSLNNPMNLSDYVTSILNLSEEFQISSHDICKLIEFQNFKREYRGGKADFYKSFNVVERYLERKHYTVRARFAFDLF